MVKEAIADNRRTSSKPKGGFGGSETIEDDHIDYTYLRAHRALVFLGSRGDHRLRSVGAKVSFIHVIQVAFEGCKWRQM